ncbi:MAG: hypothetical protein ACO4CT_11010 [Planctomycetota bacterium]
MQALDEVVQVDGGELLGPDRAEPRKPLPLFVRDAVVAPESHGPRDVAAAFGVAADLGLRGPASRRPGGFTGARSAAVPLVVAPAVVELERMPELCVADRVDPTRLGALPLPRGVVARR